jgi:hypothetical protein
VAKAYPGLGDDPRAQELLKAANAHPGIAGWMIRTTEEQVAKLAMLLSKSPFARIRSNAASKVFACGRESLVVWAVPSVIYRIPFCRA